MVYSPKIREELIPALYHYSKHLEEPMTRTVDRLIYRALMEEPLPDSANSLLPSGDDPYFRELAQSYVTNRLHEESSRDQ